MTRKSLITICGGNLVSSGLAKLNENVADLENSVAALRTEVESDRNRLENVRDESKNKIRAIREELRSLKPKPSPKSDVEVIVSTDNPQKENEPESRGKIS